MKLAIQMINAFAEQPFAGNPAAVCVLEHWLDDAVMQSIAMQNNLSETAFIVKEKGTDTASSPVNSSRVNATAVSPSAVDVDDVYRIRWFTPSVEVDLCGHATLASAYVLFETVAKTAPALQFTSRSGALHARRREDIIELDFPLDPVHSVDQIDAVARATGVRPTATLQAADLVAVYEDASQIAAMQPDQQAVAQLPGRGLVVTAAVKENSADLPASQSQSKQRVDFVSRWFGPKVGVPEDPVTGSAHCALVPYWSQQLQRQTLVAEQQSPRGGMLYCRVENDRVLIGGKAQRYLSGHIEF